jgi:hypothetical protein
MTILCKYPTRGRPDAFLKRISEWTEMCSVPSKISWLVSYDLDDSTMTPEVISRAESVHPCVICVGGNSRSKIEACNANINDYGADWDVILLVSDDFWCVRKGWDEIIRHHMREKFPDMDGALWIWDGAQKAINTLECVGRKRYEHFGYLYHPEYRSFFSDNEQTDIGLRDGKLSFIPNSIAHHQHPAWLGGMKRDATYTRNNGSWKQDEATYHRRKAAGFPS